MDTMVIICLIVGIACVGISFFIKEGADINNQEKEKIAEEIRAKALSDESLKKVMAKVEKDFTGKLSDIMEDKLGSSTDSMSEIANNKMLAINEMSGQLIERIEQNHKEVIFLYDMLNEKSDNLKDFSAKIDGMRKELENEEKRIESLNHDLDDKIVKVKEVRQTVITKPAVLHSEMSQSNTSPAENTGRVMPETEKISVTVPTQAEALLQLQKKETISEKNEEEVEQEITGKEEVQSLKPIPEKSQSITENVKDEPVREISINDKILKMKEEGKSILEISKTLEMGQGEVQLILGLYGR